MEFFFVTELWSSVSQLVVSDKIGQLEPVRSLNLFSIPTATTQKRVKELF